MIEPLKHTPGPWVLDNPDADAVFEAWHDDDLKHPLTGFASISAGSWDAFAHVATYCNGDPDAEGEANAYLIAAAPDLLAALEAGLKPNALDCEFDGQADDPHVCWCGKPKAYHWKAMARDAIAKAKGA